MKPDYLCVPPYGCINGKWISQAFQIQEQNKLKYHVTKEVINPWRRAYQTSHFYHQLEIFKPFAYILDVATIAFLLGNWVCSYLSLLPILEGVLIRWERENNLEKQESVRDSTGSKLVKNVLSPIGDDLDYKIHLHNVLDLEKTFLEMVLQEDFFFNGGKYLERSLGSRYFNRHVSSHMFKEPSYVESGLNTANIFLF